MFPPPFYDCSCVGLWTVGLQQEEVPVQKIVLRSSGREEISRQPGQLLLLPGKSQEELERGLQKPHAHRGGGIVGEDTCELALGSLGSLGGLANLVDQSTSKISFLLLLFFFTVVSSRKFFSFCLFLPRDFCLRGVRLKKKVCCG